jgi:hypothetical protein
MNVYDFMKYHFIPIVFATVISEIFYIVYQIIFYYI